VCANLTNLIVLVCCAIGLAKAHHHHHGSIDANVVAVQRPLDDRVREQDGLASACITGGVHCAAMAVAQSLQNRRGWRGGKQVFNLGQQ